MAVATAAAAATTLYLVFGPVWLGPPWNYLPYGTCALLALFFGMAVVQRRRAAVAFQAVVLSVCLLLPIGNRSIEDGHADVKTRLTVTGVPKGQVPQVAWSHPGGAWPHPTWVDEPWEAVPGDGAVNEFQSEGLAQCSFHNFYLRKSGGWYFGAFESRLIVIVADRKRFRFEAPSIFRPKNGLEPGEFAATFDIGDYVSGKKEPPGLDWPPDDRDVMPADLSK